MPLFPLVKEIKSKAGVLHFRRWRVFETDSLRLYLHCISHHDEDVHLHTHPWHFWSFVLWGSYTEETREGLETRQRWTLAHRDAATPHKLHSVPSSCWTLVLAHGTRREWGYDVNNTLVPHDTYRAMKNAAPPLA